MDLNRLRLFHVVAQHGSYSRAAEALDLSQPSVSVQVHQLERALGTYLFYQVGRKLQLTEEGRLLLKYADQIFALEQRAESAVRELSGLEQGRLVVGASFTVGTYMLPKVLSEFYRRHPGVEVALEMGTSLEAQEHILGNEQDIAFVGRNIAHPLLDVAPYAVDELVFIAPGGHPFSQRARVTIKELTSEPFVLREKGSITRELFEAELGRLGTDYEVALEVEGPEGVKQAVAAGLGVAVISHDAVTWEIQAGRLSTVNVPELALERPLYHVQLKNRPGSRSVDSLLALVNEIG